jgi:hypothetical protein
MSQMSEAPKRATPANSLALRDSVEVAPTFNVS